MRKTTALEGIEDQQWHTLRHYQKQSIVRSPFFNPFRSGSLLTRRLRKAEGEGGIFCGSLDVNSASPHPLAHLSNARRKKKIRKRKDPACSQLASGSKNENEKCTPPQAKPKGRPKEEEVQKRRGKKKERKSGTTFTAPPIPFSGGSDSSQC